MNMTALCEKTDKGYIIKSPAVGVYLQIPKDGQLINTMNDCGLLSILGKKYSLVLPPKIEGRVKRASELETTPVGYEGTLFFLEAITSDSTNVSSDHENTEEKTQNKKVILSLIDGIFYGRSAPDEPPYVAVGSKVSKGQVLGLVEVMKTFNQVIYSGDSLPQEGIIKEICVEDGCEVKGKQVLFILE